MTRSLIFLLFAVCTAVQPCLTQTPSVTCNDKINVAVNHTCAVELSVDAFIEGDVTNNMDVQNGLYTYEVYNHTGTIVRGDINGPFFGGDNMEPWINSLLFFKVFYDDKITCWGTMLLEDKILPTVDCSVCPPVYGDSPDDYAPDCVRNCFEKDILLERYDSRLRDRIVQEDYEDFLDDYVEDNCSNWAPELTSFYDVWQDFGPCQGSRLTRTWKVAYENYDNSVGYINCVREYFFKPIDLQKTKEYDVNPLSNKQEIKPIENCLILPVNLVEIDCSFDNSPAGIAHYYDDKNTFDLDSDDNNQDPDELDVDLVVENNEGIPYAFPHYYSKGVGASSVLHPQAVKNELCNLITGYTDNNLEVCAPGCSGNKKILRNWTILDWCTGQYISYGQVIKSVDRHGPEIEIPEITVSVDPWSCAATVQLPHPEHIFDNCDSYSSYYIGLSGGLAVTGNAENGFVLHDAYLGQHQIEYKSVDCCGNVGRSYLNITVVDNTPPVAVSKEFIVISLTNISNPINGYQGTAKVYARDLDNGSYDGCTEVTIEISRDPVCRNADANWGEYVTFCCEDLEGFANKEIDVQLRITDANGNVNNVWSKVLLEDKSSAYPTAPDHMILTCDMDINDFDLTGGFPRIYGACGEAEFNCDTTEVIENTEPRQLRISDGVVINGIPQEAPAYDPGCGYGAIRREFRNCGGGFQWFIIQPVDPFDNTSIIWPEDDVVDCNDYNNGEPGWPETTCNLVGVSLESDTFHFEAGSCMKILNHWTIINWCVYDPSNQSSPGKYTHTQVIKIVDTIDPEVSAQDSLCYSVLEDCTSKDVVLEASAMDNGRCGSQWIAWELSIDAYSDWTEDYNYSSVNARYQPDGQVNPFYIPKSGNGESIGVALPDGIPASGFWHRAIWRAYDGCGNTSSRMIYFQITDKKAPTPYCLNLSTAVMENGQVELWAIDFNKDSFDNCSPDENLLYTFTDIAPPPRNDSEYDSNADLQWYNGQFWYFDSEEADPVLGAGAYESQDDYGDEVHRWEPALQSAGKIFTADDADNDGFVEVPVYVWDDYGNKDFCRVNLRLIDNAGGGQGMVAGKVITEFGQPVESIHTELAGPLNFRTEDITNASGEYAFSDTPFFADYKLSGYRNDDYLNGVSTLDLVLIQRHILGQQDLDSPYKLIAADVNEDNLITAVDLLELRKLILGVYNALPNAGSWKLVNADDVLSLENPWNYSETRAIEDLLADQMQEDFIGVKMGDVNASVIANALQAGLAGRSSDKTRITYSDVDLQAGESYDLNLNFESQELYGMQLALHAPGLKLLDVDGVLQTNNIYQDGDIISISIDSPSEPLRGDLNIKVLAHVDARLSDILQLNETRIKSEAYVGRDVRISNIELKTLSESIGPELYQNVPNPFTGTTDVSFRLPNEAEVTFEIYSLTGQVVKQIKQKFPAGLNTINLDSQEFTGEGMYYYKVETGEFSDIKQMVLIK